MSLACAKAGRKAAHVEARIRLGLKTREFQGILRRDKLSKTLLYTGLVISSVLAGAGTLMDLLGYSYVSTLPVTMGAAVSFFALAVPGVFLSQRSGQLSADELRACSKNWGIALLQDLAPGKG